jgi:allantoinase
MANSRVPFRLSTRRPILTPPEAGRIMVHLVVNVDSWRTEEPTSRTIITPAVSSEAIPVRADASLGDYGMRAGLPRILDAISQRGLPAAASLDPRALEDYPAAVEAMVEAGWEIVGRGQSAATGTEDESANIQRLLEQTQQFTGSRPRGWLGAGVGGTTDTPDLLVDAGIEYVLDSHDDLPNWMHVKRGSLMQVPYSLELDDTTIYGAGNQSSEEFLQRLQRTLTLFELESEEQPRVLSLGLHPHLTGMPHRFGYLEDMLDLLLRSQHVCFMTSGQIADWYREQEPPLA